MRMRVGLEARQQSDADEQHAIARVAHFLPPRTAFRYGHVDAGSDPDVVHRRVPTSSAILRTNCQNLGDSVLRNERPTEGSGVLTNAVRNH